MLSNIDQIALAIYQNAIAEDRPGGKQPLEDWLEIQAAFSVDAAYILFDALGKREHIELDREEAELEDDDDDDADWLADDATTDDL